MKQMSLDMFIIWKIKPGLWAGLDFEKKIKDYEQLLWPVFLKFSWAKKINLTFLKNL